MTLLLSITLSSLSIYACDAPVYDYALRYWRPAEYRVYYFYRGSPDPCDARVNRYLGSIAKGVDEVANLDFTAIDVNGLRPEKQGTEPQLIWSECNAKKLPFHVVLTPTGTKLFIGRLNAQMAKALVESPARKTIANELCSGKQGLLLLLCGRDGHRNAMARRIVRKVVSDALYRGRKIAIVEISQVDPNEKWLVQQLLSFSRAVNDADAPLVFGIFGRGCVLGPPTDKALTEDSVAELVELMNAPCGCDLKMNIFGYNLLIKWDWDAHLPATAIQFTDPSYSALFDMSSYANDAQATTLSQGDSPPASPISKRVLRILIALFALLIIFNAVGIFLLMRYGKRL